MKPVIESADQFKKGSYYEFPFTALDPTPGGSNLGRIEWCIELFPGKKSRREGRYFIEKLLVFARQTRDERYAGKTFEIPCNVEMINGSRMKGPNFLAQVWAVEFCSEHKAIILTAYPENHHTKLTIYVNSSIMMDISFS